MNIRCLKNYFALFKNLVFEKVPEARTEGPREQGGAPEGAGDKAKRDSIIDKSGTLELGDVDKVMPADVKMNMEKCAMQVKSVLKCLSSTIEEVKNNVVSDRIKSSLIGFVRTNVNALCTRGMSIKPEAGDVKGLLRDLSAYVKKVDYDLANNTLKIQGFETEAFHNLPTMAAGMEYQGKYEEGQFTVASSKMTESGGDAEEEGGFTPPEDLTTNYVHGGVGTAIGRGNIGVFAGVSGVGIGGGYQVTDRTGIRVNMSTTGGNAGFDYRIGSRKARDEVILSADVFTDTAGAPSSLYGTVYFPRHRVGLSVHGGYSTVPGPNVGGFQMQLPSTNPNAETGTHAGANAMEAEARGNAPYVGVSIGGVLPGEPEKK